MKNNSTLPAYSNSNGRGATRRFWAGVFVSAVRLSVAFVLLFAATVKLASFRGVPQIDFVSANWVLLLAPLIEFALGFLLLSGKKPGFGYLAPICFFVATSMYGIWSLANGRTTCPCLGEFRTPTSYSLIASLFCLGLLLGTWSLATKSVGQGPAMPFRIATLTIIGMCIGIGLYASSDKTILRRWTGPPLVVEKVEPQPISVDFLNGNYYEYSVRIRNNSLASPIEILGSHFGHESQVQSLPITIPPGSVATVRIRAHCLPIPKTAWDKTIEAEAKYIAALRKEKEVTEHLTQIPWRVFLTTNCPEQSRLDVQFKIAATDDFIQRVQTVVAKLHVSSTPIQISLTKLMHN